MHLKFRDAELRRSGPSMTITGNDDAGNPVRITGIVSVTFTAAGITAIREAGSDVIELLAQAQADGAPL